MLLHRYGPKGVYLGTVEYNFELDDMIETVVAQQVDDDGETFTFTRHFAYDLNGVKSKVLKNFEVEGVMHHMPSGLTDKEPPAVNEGEFVVFSGGDWKVVTDDPSDLEFTEKLAKMNRDNRLKLLQESDVSVNRYIERGEAVPQDLVDYRQALRDISEQVCFPLFVYAPKKPESLL
jgi:hypothetical protein